MEKNKVIEYFEKKEEIENANKDILEISFFNKRIIKHNWQRKKTQNFKPIGRQKKTLPSRKYIKVYK